MLPLLLAIDSTTVNLKAQRAQNFSVPSPLRPHTTIAIEKLNMAARDAQATVNNTDYSSVSEILPRFAFAPAPLKITVMTSSSPSSSTLLERQKTTQRYPEAKVIVLDDDVNTFQHVVDCLRKIIPGMDEEKAWGLAHRIDGQGSAEVWRGPLEQAELYHLQLQTEGLTMAPLDRC